MRAGMRLLLSERSGSTTMGSSMELERIEVQTRDEYRGAQDPTHFIWRGRDFRVARVLDRWYEGFFDSTRLPLRYFKVETSEGRTFLLRYHELFTAWSIVVPRDEPESE